MRILLINKSGYDTQDLLAFCRRGFKAMGIKRWKRVIITASPIRTRGCAEVTKDKAGATLSIAIAAPSRFTLRKLGAIFEHECLHLLGYQHEDMPEGQLWSDGVCPDWAKALKVRYRGRAPNQMAFLK